MGSLNLLDLPYCADYTARLAYVLDGAKTEDVSALSNQMGVCHFEYEGSTHAMHVEAVGDGELGWRCECTFENSVERAHSGSHSLKVTAKAPMAGSPVRCIRKTYYYASDFHDSRYDPSFSPTLVPGETLHVSVLIPEYSVATSVRAYVKLRGGKVLNGETVHCKKENWYDLVLTIPPMEGELIEEAGVELLSQVKAKAGSMVAFIDDLFFDGKPDYTIDFSNETLEQWSGSHTEITQMTILKGIKYLEENALHLACSDRAEMYTGKINWTDVTVSCDLRAQTGSEHYMLARVQGAERNYAFGFSSQGKIALLKNSYGYSTLCEIPFAWELGKEYHLSMQLTGAQIICFVNDQPVLHFTDDHEPYLRGAIGIAVKNGSHVAVRRMSVR